MSLFGKSLSEVATDEKIVLMQEANVSFDTQTLLNLGFNTKYSTIKAGNYSMSIELERVLVWFELFEK